MSCRPVLMFCALAWWGDALAAAPPTLKEIWVAAGASSQTVLVNDAAGVSLLSLVNTGTTRSLVRVDAVTGAVQWQTDVVPGVGWGSFAVHGNDVIVQGEPLSAAGKAQVAIVAVGTGERRWTRTVAGDQRLQFGENGGLALIGPCSLEVLDTKGDGLATLAGLRASADATGVGGRGMETLCSAMPRVLGEAQGRVIVAVPEGGSSWRVDAIGRAGTGWTASLGSLTSSPEVDWRTGVFWAQTRAGLLLRRYNLATGQVAWDSVRPLGGCGPVTRPVKGPLGAPSILLQVCDVLTLIDPHDGRDLWQVADGTGDAVLDGESFGLPEWVQPGEVRSIRWLDGNGKPSGRAGVDDNSFGVPVAEGLLARSSTAVSLTNRQGQVVWTLSMGNPRWALMGDLLVVAPEIGDVRYVVKLATGEIAGQFSGGEAVGVVPIPGSEVARMLFTQGDQLRALKLVIRP